MFSIAILNRTHGHQVSEKYRFVYKFRERGGIRYHPRDELMLHDSRNFRWNNIEESSAEVVLCLFYGSSIETSNINRLQVVSVVYVRSITMTYMGCYTFVESKKDHLDNVTSISLTKIICFWPKEIDQFRFHS